ncbi:hypothetical protein [Paractinoplanes ferrugineus]|uniref:hypothetical protein n=1 Tax=Paractinoplanes ferrugineus TaxID=113564 RepID=UPI001944137B|nr:hypothetical protein [Actinoplanes ferrugineus]
MWTLFDAVDTDEPADIEVMTPERLAHLLRHGVDAVLDRFGLFIFFDVEFAFRQPAGKFGRNAAVRADRGLTERLTRVAFGFSAAFWSGNPRRLCWRRFPSSPGGRSMTKYHSVLVGVWYEPMVTEHPRGTELSCPHPR